MKKLKKIILIVVIAIILILILMVAFSSRAKRVLLDVVGQIAIDSYLFKYDVDELVEQYNNRELLDTNVNYNLSTNTLSENIISKDGINVQIVSYENGYFGENKDKQIRIGFKVSREDQKPMYNALWNTMVVDNYQNVLSYHEILNEEYLYYRLGYSNDVMGSPDFMMFFSNNMLKDGVTMMYEPYTGELERDYTKTMIINIPEYYGNPKVLTISLINLKYRLAEEAGEIAFPNSDFRFNIEFVKE